MIKSGVTFLFLFLMLMSSAQEISLPVDFRQHTLTEYNSSLLHPVFSLNGRSYETIALWARWQWQSIDTDPTNLFLNYRRRLNANSAAGVAFFQHNTERYLKTGGVLNYAYSLELSENTTIAIGINLIGFKYKLTDTTFQQGSPLSTGNDFVLQMAPGLLFSVDRFNLGIASENLYDYNFNTKERQSLPTDKTYLGLVSYDFTLQLPSAEKAVLRPILYMKSIPGFDTQIGFNSLFTADKFWAQAGYNSHYGISAGGGGRFFKKFSIGVLMEFGTDASLKGVDPSFEFISAYDFGALDGRKKVVGFEMDENDKSLDEQLESELDKQEAEIARREQSEKEELEREKRKRVSDSLAAKNRMEEQLKIDAINKTKEEALMAQKMEQKRKQDSLVQLKLDEAEALKNAELKKIAEAEAAKKLALEKKVQEEEAQKPEANEKYEEVTTEDGLEPGYYLIANVFGTKKYFEAFKRDLTSKGLEPKSFFRSLNKYNYVYLKRYNTMTEARKARDGNFDGRYPDKTWIFRVIGE